MAEAIQHGECIEKIMNAFAQIGHELTNKQAEQFFLQMGLLAAGAGILLNLFRYWKLGGERRVKS